MKPKSKSTLYTSLLAVFIFLGPAGCGDKLLGVAGSISVGPTSLAFGTVPVGQSPSVAVSVSNQGNAALQIISISVSSDPNGELAVAGLLTMDCSGNARSGSTTLSPGECAMFAVIWTPLAAHAALGSVEVDSTDAQSPAITLPVSGSSTVAGAPTCESSCASGMCCDDVCVDTQNDPAHCGGCNACAAGDSCAAGVCTPPVATQNGCDDLTNPCGSPDKCCNHVCTDVSASGGVCPCTSTGSTSTFAVGSIIIPMDVCWQRGKDETTTPSYCNGKNRKTAGDDAPLKAYGLVFFLIRHGVTVFVAIDPGKTAIDSPDMTLVSLDGKPPVLRYDWGSGTAVALPDQTQNAVQYRGGPFLIDASQHDRVLQLLASDPDFAQFRSAASITVHIANEGFQSTVAKSISAVPSRIALLSPKGDNSTYQILVRYLESAGLNFAGAGGTPTNPGQIYDQLQEADFLPDYAGSNLKMNGYKLLWSPHWEGGTSNTAAQLQTIGDYVNAGGDLFAECAAIGTLEGFSGDELGGGGGGAPGSAATRFMTSSGMTGNSLNFNNDTYAGPFTYAGLDSVFAQRGDFPYAGFNGAITDFRPASSSSYHSGVVRYVSKSVGGTETDLFASYDQRAAAKGTVVYLAGHDYSYGGDYDGDQGTTAGSRLVLNTLFSLGTNDVCNP